MDWLTFPQQSQYSFLAYHAFLCPFDHWCSYQTSPFHQLLFFSFLYLSIGLSCDPATFLSAALSCHHHCLGVLTDVSLIWSMSISRWIMISGEVNISTQKYMLSVGWLPLPQTLNVMDWATLPLITILSNGLVNISTAITIQLPCYLSTFDHWCKSQTFTLTLATSFIISVPVFKFKVNNDFWGG